MKHDVSDLARNTISSRNTLSACVHVFLKRDKGVCYYYYYFLSPRQVQRYNTSVSLAGAVTYNKADTPSVTNIEPSDAGTGGGKLVSTNKIQF